MNKLLLKITTILLFITSLEAKSEFEDKYQLKCINNKLIIPSNYGISLKEKMNLLSLLLLNGHLGKTAQCSSLQYVIMPHILNHSIEHSDTYLAQLIFSSNIKYLLGEELFERYFMDFQLPLLIKFNKIDLLELNDSDFEILVNKFCSNDVGDIKNMIKSGFYDRRYVLNTIPKSNFLSKFEKAIKQRISCELDGFPFLIKNQKWNNLLTK